MTGDRGPVKGDILSPREFLDKILGIKRHVWPAVAEDLQAALWDREVNEVVKLDAIGSGKSTFAELAICYILYCFGMCKDPAAAFPNIMPGSKIAIVVGALREKQAREIVFGTMKERVARTKWFQDNYMFEENGARNITFPNNIVVMSCSSSETAPIGYNVIMGVLDEGDWFIRQSHIGDSQDQGENVWSMMYNRAESRFGEKRLLILVSSARNPEGFMVRRHAELKELGEGFLTQRPQWMSKPDVWEPYFVVDLNKMGVIRELSAVERAVVKRQVKTYPKLVDQRNAELGMVRYTAIPERYYAEFLRRPREFLRDRASILLTGLNAFVSRPDLIIMNDSRKSPIEVKDGKRQLAEWFKPTAPVYWSHNDLAHSGDKCVLAVGHQDGQNTVIDLVWVVDPKIEGKVEFSEVRDVFKEMIRRGFLFGKITFDQFQSRDTMQILESWGVPTELYSVDRDKEAYDLWRQAHYDGLVDIYPVDGYMEDVRSLLEIRGVKVDHVKHGSKDITDAVAGTLYHCRTEGMGQALEISVLGTGSRK